MSDRLGILLSPVSVLAPPPFPAGMQRRRGAGKTLPLCSLAALLLCFIFLSLVPSVEVLGLEWVVGNQEHPWEEWGGEMAHSIAEGGKEVPDYWVDWWGRGFQPREKIVEKFDITTKPGWIQPVHVDSSINLCLGLKERAIRTFPWRDLSSGWNEGERVSYSYIDQPESMIDGYSTTVVINRGGIEYHLHTMLYYDLGWAFPVNRIRFYTRPEAKLLHMKAYTVAVNDGDPAVYEPHPADPTGYDYWPLAIRKWVLIAQELINEEHDIDLRFPTQYVRYVAVGDTTIPRERKTRWEIAELEVYGEGYVQSATYTSKVIDFGKPANWGHLRWHAEIDPGARLILRTRSGRTPDPYRYYLWTGIGPTGEMEVSRSEYIKTKKDIYKKWLAGRVVLDTDNWSFWSPPYPLTGDEAIVSPGPARYFQFELSFESSSPSGCARVDSLTIQYSSPPVAQELVGEVAYDPQEIVPGQWAEFRYALRARFQRGDTGFDAIQIATPDRPDPGSIGDLKVNNVEVKPDSIQVADDGFTVYLPEKIEPKSAVDSALVELSFEARVYVYGTRLLGRVFDSKDLEALPQPILPGDATEDIDTDDLQVVWALGGSLLGSISLSSNPFTPNGDGVNDQVEVSYSLLQVDRKVPVSLTIYDLSGKAVYGLTCMESSGRKVMVWGGEDDEGRRVSPGVYLWQIIADTASGQYVRSGTITVVY